MARFIAFMMCIAALIGAVCMGLVIHQVPDGSRLYNEAMTCLVCVVPGLLLVLLSGKRLRL